jgi:VWFA-related protein
VAVFLLLLTVVSDAKKQDGRVFRGRTDLVALDVAVKDKSGRPVESLIADDFLVIEDNVPQRLQFFSPPGGVPLAVVLLVDYSQSMAGEPLACAKRAVAAFLNTLGAEDLVQVLAFNDVPVRIYPMGPGGPAAAEAVEQLEAKGTTRLYDSIVVAQRDLDRAVRHSAQQYQKAIVILSDGEDTRSSQTFDDVLDDARRSTTAVSAISIRTDEHGRWLPPPYEITQLTMDTGGQTVTIRHLSDLTAAYQDIQADLRQQYRLGYVSSSSDNDGRWRRVSVRVRDANLVARTRSGYYAPWAAAPQTSGE